MCSLSIGQCHKESERLKMSFFFKVAVISSGKNKGRASAVCKDTEAHIPGHFFCIIRKKHKQNSKKNIGNVNSVI